jgi:hypothetical protein
MTQGSNSLDDLATQMEKAALEKARCELKKNPQEFIGEFLDTLATTSGIDSKKLSLWRQIYINASNDRDLAAIVYTSLYAHMNQSEVAHHAIYGPILSKYLERMNKTTDQLLKLAEIVAAELDKLEVIDADDVYDKISG